VIQLAIHPSQFPDRVQADLCASLRTREVRHKFHYESHKQAQKWLQVHEIHSPARHDPQCLALYETAFDWLANRFGATSYTPAAPKPNGQGGSPTSPTLVHVVGLGCGGGQKDAALLQRLKAANCNTHYTAVDVSVPLVITARLRAAPFANSTAGLVCDLETADDLPDSWRDELHESHKVQHRIFTFFGMIPNSEPDVILPRLQTLLDAGDTVLLSANLAPGPDYLHGVKSVFPQYDNRETAAWLLTFLYDLGVERDDGRLLFRIEESSGLFRIRADFHFAKARWLSIGQETIQFAPGDQVRLFYSYRYTPELLNAALSKHDLTILQQWLTSSGEEGIFLATKK
jgi:L-histidine Nalpha-methyltransferase